MARLHLREEEEMPLEARLIRARQDDSTGNLSSSPVRQAFKEIFVVQAEYVFLRTVANPHAVAELRKPEHREAYAKRRGIDHDDFSVYFSPELLESYLVAIRRTLDGLAEYHSYPLIGGNRHFARAEWPVVHIVRKTDEEWLRMVVRDLNEQGAYDCIARHEAPQNYRMFEVDLLRKKQIAPLVFQERRWDVKGSELRNALDFLVPFEYAEPSSGSCCYDDD